MNQVLIINFYNHRKAYLGVRSKRCWLLSSRLVRHHDHAITIVELDSVTHTLTEGWAAKVDMHFLEV